MALMMTELYDALRGAGVDDGAARRAAQAVSGGDLPERFDRQAEQMNARLTRFEARLQLLTLLTVVLLTVSGGIFTGTMLIVLDTLRTTSG